MEGLFPKGNQLDINGYINKGRNRFSIGEKLKIYMRSVVNKKDLNKGRRKVGYIRMTI